MSRRAAEIDLSAEEELAQRALWDSTNDFDSPHFATHAIALEMLFGIHINFWNKYQSRETPVFGDISA